MRAALRGDYVVRKRHDRLVVLVGVLERNLGDPELLLRLHVYDIRVYHVAVLVPVQIFDKADDSALVMKNILPDLSVVLRKVALVAHDYPDTRVEERLLPHSVQKRVIVKNRLLKYLTVRHESDIKPAPI